MLEINTNDMNWSLLDLKTPGIYRSQSESYSPLPDSEGNEPRQLFRTHVLNLMDSGIRIEAHSNFVLSEHQSSKDNRKEFLHFFSNTLTEARSNYIIEPGIDVVSNHDRFKIYSGWFKFEEIENLLNIKLENISDEPFELYKYKKFTLALIHEKEPIFTQDMKVSDYFDKLIPNDPEGYDDSGIVTLNLDEIVLPKFETIYCSTPRVGFQSNI